MDRLVPEDEQKIIVYRWTDPQSSGRIHTLKVHKSGQIPIRKFTSPRVDELILNDNYKIHIVDGSTSR